jgi:hypothetical protein
MSVTTKKITIDISTLFSGVSNQVVGVAPASAKTVSMQVNGDSNVDGAGSFAVNLQNRITEDFTYQAIPSGNFDFNPEADTDEVGGPEEFTGNEFNLEIDKGTATQGIVTVAVAWR